MHQNSIPNMELYDLRVEYTKDPVGIDATDPRFFWKIKSSLCDVYQYAYQIIVSSSLAKLEADDGDEWDSGKIVSGETIHIAYKGSPLKSGQKYYWKTKVWTADDSECFDSGPASFVTGLFTPSDWQGSWIGTEDDIDSILLRKNFILKREVKKAMLHICGLGFFEAYINGEKVGNHVLDPNWTDFDKRNIEKLLYPYDDNSSKRVLYLSYDVKQYLSKDKNAIGVILGNGWYNQRERTVEGRLWYNTPRMLCQLNVEYTDGSSESFPSDMSWKAAQSPIVSNNIFYGETYDAGLEQAGWSDADFDDSLWSEAIIKEKPSGKLVSQISTHDTVECVISPQNLSEPSRGMYVFDIGRNISGWVRIRVKGAVGTKIVMRFSEELTPDGKLDFLSTTGNASSEQIQKDEYILKASDNIQIYEPRFTWHGFRYVEITGWPGKPELEDIEAVSVHTDVETAGKFSCSDGLINEICGAFINSQLSNMHCGVPSDCPHIERLGYTGDGHVAAQAAICSFDMAKFYTKWINDISDSQNIKTGFVPHTVPFGGGGGGPGWGCAYIFMPWYMYLYYEDKKILEQNYAGMRKWIEYLKSRTDDGAIVEREEPGAWCLGDWAMPGEAVVPERLVNTYFYAEALRIMSDVALILHDYENGELYKEQKEAVHKAFHAEFFDKERGMYSVGRQGADVFALSLGAVPVNIREDVARSMGKRIAEENGGHLDTGIFATPLLLDVLTAYGMQDIAYDVLTKTTFPSYGYMFENGATTLWENWDGQRSHNHPMFGSVIAWFYQTICGIKSDSDKPAYRNIIIKPAEFSGIEWAAASIETIRGFIGVKWEKKADSYSLKAEIPANCSAEIYIPKFGNESVEIVLEDTIVWGEGKFFLHEKIVRCLEGADSIMFEVGNGVYEFEVKNLSWSTYEKG